jgi:hypothetical protein
VLFTYIWVVIFVFLSPKCGVVVLFIVLCEVFLILSAVFVSFEVADQIQLIRGATNDIKNWSHRYYIPSNVLMVTMTLVNFLSTSQISYPYVSKLVVLETTNMPLKSITSLELLKLVALFFKGIFHGLSNLFILKFIYLYYVKPKVKLKKRKLV